MRIIGHSRQPATPHTSQQIPARKSTDAQFLALLRRKCVLAASAGALTATAESIPGLRHVLGLMLGELLDAHMLTAIQRELIQDTFAIYQLDLPAAVQSTLVNKVQLLGASASVAGDAFARSTLQRMLGGASSVLARRVVPIAAIASSAVANATVTYAIGKRAQAVARQREAPITALPDAVRAFSGIDERRIYAWSISAIKDSLSLIGKSLGRLATAPLRRAASRARVKV